MDLQEDVQDKSITLGVCTLHINHETAKNTSMLALYRNANAAKFDACSAASFAITFSFLRKDILLPNRNVITGGVSDVARKVDVSSVRDYETIREERWCQ